MRTRQQLANRRKTIAALRSGKYTQTKGALRIVLADGGVRHCCLGVASEVCQVPMLAEDNRGNRAWFPASNWETPFDFAELVQDGWGGTETANMPHSAAARLFGITSAQGEEFASAAVEYNDDRRKSFKFIATRMERFFVACDAWNKQHGLEVPV